MSIRLCAWSLLGAWMVLSSMAASATEYYVYIASGQDGIHRLDFDSDSGETGAIAHVVEREGGVGFFEFSRDRKFFLAQGRIPGAAGCAISYRVDGESGGLTGINEIDAKGGSCHVNVDATGRMAVVANYGGGSVVSMPLSADGTLGAVASYHVLVGSSVHPTRQREAHPHSANFTPDNKFVVVPDLGQDKLFVYRSELETGRLLEHDTPFFAMAPGSGPRHMTFHPEAPLAFVINELASTLAVLAYDGEAGTFAHLQTATTLPEDFEGNSSTAEVLVHPNGNFVYASNRGHNSIAVFALDRDASRVSLVEREPTGGDHPRNFRLSPDGKYLFVANMNSDNIVLFSIDPETGALSPAGSVLEVSRPMCIRFLER